MIEKIKEFNFRLLVITIVISMLSTVLPPIFSKSITIIVNNIWFLILLICDCLIVLKGREHFGNIKININANKALCISLLLYYVYEVIVFLKSDVYGYSIMRMAIMAKLSILIITFIICNDRKGNIKILLKGIGSTSIALSFISMVLYYTDRNYYLEKISTILDYNVFAEYIFFGMVCAVVYVCISNYKYYVKGILFTLVVGLNTSVILHSGSRRGLVYIMFFLGLMSIYGIYRLIKTKKYIRNIICYSCVFIVVLGSIGIQNYCFTKHIYNYYMVEPNSVVENESSHSTETESGEKQEFKRGKGETSYKDRYDTLKNNEGEALASREKIWEIAIDTIKEESLYEVVFGQGASYSKQIYENTNDIKVQALMKSTGTDSSEKQWMSPHNILLTTILEGGIVELLILTVIHLIILGYVVFMGSKKYILLCIILMMEFAGIFILGCDNGVLSDELWIIYIIIIMSIRSSERSRYGITGKLQ